MAENELKPLNKAQLVFVSEYLKLFNATAAYLVAYPKSKRDSARANAARLIAEDNVKAEIGARLAEIHMSADEAIKRLADMARGDVSDFLNGFGGVDLDKAKGKTHLIRKIKQRTITKIGKGDKDEDTEITDIELELYSALDAIEKILKIGGKLKDADININVNITDD